MAAMTANQPRLDAVIFDLDGTLVDTEYLWTEVRKELAKEDGVPWPKAAYFDMMGMNTLEWSTYLVEKVGLKCSVEEAARRNLEGLADYYRKGKVRIMPGAIEAVEAMAKLTKVGIASSSSRSLIATAVESIKIGELVQVQVSTEQVEKGKPAPDGFLLAAEMLGADPKYCIAIEDAPNGVRSALAAGMITVAIPTDYADLPDDLVAQVDIQLNSLEEFTTELALELASQRS